MYTHIHANIFIFSLSVIQSLFLSFSIILSPVGTFSIIQFYVPTSIQVKARGNHFNPREDYSLGSVTLRVILLYVIFFCIGTSQM